MSVKGDSLEVKSSTLPAKERPMEASGEGGHDDDWAEVLGHRRATRMSVARRYFMAEEAAMAFYAPWLMGGMVACLWLSASAGQTMVAAEEVGH